MNSFIKVIFCLSILLTGKCLFAQNSNSIYAELLPEQKSLTIQQEIIFYNTGKDSLSKIILNDWNNAFSDKNTPLAKRFSDEFVRSFHLAKSYERGNTSAITIIDENKSFLDWCRPEKHPDLIEVTLSEKIAPNQKIKFNLTYRVKIPSDKFTKYGYTNERGFNLKNWFLTPARFENNAFCMNSNYNVDDITNAPSDYSITFKTPLNQKLFTDLDIISTEKQSKHNLYTLEGKNRTDFRIYTEEKITYNRYKNGIADVYTNLKDNRLDDIQKAVIIDKIVKFTDENIGSSNNTTIIVSQADYERNPFYGLNQLPAFISPYPDSFLYEIKFLKTYVSNYLKSNLKLNAREDNWIYDAIQVHIMMKYIDENYPEMKMMGNISKLKILKGFNLFNLDFNEQYSYYYLLMARKNLDQPIGNPKNTLLKFNEQIAGKYRAGLSLKYLDDYCGNNLASKSIHTFVELNRNLQTSEKDFENILRNNCPNNIDWFFETIINSREIVDYKFTDVTKTNDSITFTVRNKTGVVVPIPIYGLKKGEIVFKEWLEDIKNDTTITMSRKEADRIVLNYENEVPEYNLRNNWKSLKNYSFNDRPIKFNFLKDLEDPYHNQILYVPTLEYNLYNGLMPGMRFHNKTFLDKPILFDINPAYSTLTQKMIGNFRVVGNQFRRNSNIYLIRYQFSGQFFDYAQDASYIRFNPMIQFFKRPDNYRDNRKESLMIRQVIVEREESPFVSLEGRNENYSIFNMRYFNVKTEVKNHFGFRSDLQIANSFGKVATEIEYRKLFESNRQVNLRLYAGSFLYRKTNSDFFSFALDRPTDYLFDYGLYGRSETSGLFSQQYIVAEGAFKSKLNTPFANQWITTFNSSVNIWNWIEVYGDIGALKNENESAKFVYDSGIRLNLVTDYFELYFPVYSSNGWEVGNSNYGERIRFMVTLSPNVLVSLFTRKWF